MLVFAQPWNQLKQPNTDSHNSSLPPHIWERRNPVGLCPPQHTAMNRQQQNSHYTSGLMVLFILVQNKLCIWGICLQLACVLSTGQEERAVGRPGEEALLKLAARGSHGIRAVPVHTHQKERRGEMDCTGGALTAPSDPQLRCYLEDGLLDPEGGQQNWCRTLSSLPRKGGARKKRDRGRESQGTALGKFSLKFVCFCFQIHK